MTQKQEVANLKVDPYQKRQFIPEEIDLTNTKEVYALHEKLIDREVSSKEDLEQWILHRSELEAALSQQGSILYIRMTCQTDDQERSENYAKFVQELIPAIKPLNDQLNKKYLAYKQKYPLDAYRYEVHDREVEVDVEMFVPENIELQTQVEVLSQEYQTVCGAMTVEFDGQEQTMPQMGRYFLVPDRNLREKAWHAVAERRAKDTDQLNKIFDDMVALRHQIALNAQFDNFRDYQFKAYHRFDYTSDDCKKYHQTAREVILPLWKKICQHRMAELEVDELRPWDMAVDIKNRAPLRPFQHVNDLVEGAYEIFKRLDPDLGVHFGMMKKMGLLDLESRKGKAPGGYQSALDEARKPFIFMNAVGVDQDVRTLLHEGGHAFHSLACAQDPLLDYRHGPMEFNEVASMAMELLAGEHMNVFYKEEDFARSKQEHLEDIIQTLIWVANIDAFQHWIYENPQHTAQERTNAWLGIYEQFGGDIIQWNGLRQHKENIWHKQLHIFEVPFYYIEYGIAQLGALQIWKQAKSDPKKALANYKNGLLLGGSRPLPELYAAAGIQFDFSEEIVKPLVWEVEKELEAVSRKE